MRQMNYDSPVIAYEIAENEDISMYDIIALDEDGNAVAATDIADINVIGYAFNVNKIDNLVEVKSGIVAFTNDTTSPVTRSMRAQACYVKDATTVCASSTNSVAVGVVIDVSDDEVFVDMTATAIAVAKASSNIVALQDVVEDLSEA